MDGDSSGRDEMAAPERVLVQVAVTGPRRISISVLRVREPERGELPADEHPEETVTDEGEIREDRRLYVLEPGR